MDRFKMHFSTGAIPRKVMFSYLLDYIIVAALIVAFTSLDAIEPFNQHFSLENYTLQYPFAVKERVPVPLAALLSVGFPVAVIAIYTLVIDGLFSNEPPSRSARGVRKLVNTKYSLKERLWELNCGVLGLLLSVGVTITITGALKNTTGKPRPDVIDRCQPKAGSADLLVFGLSNSTICTQKDHAILKDGFRSFPSGHSSTAFAGLFYLSLYLAAKLHVLDKRGEVWKTFVVMVPTLAAALIADSRIMDARHHPFDVLFGSLLGVVVAWGAYRQYFPPLSQPSSKGRAYPIRTWGKLSSHAPDVDSETEHDEVPLQHVRIARARDSPERTERNESPYSNAGITGPQTAYSGAFAQQNTGYDARGREDYGSEQQVPPAYSRPG